MATTPRQDSLASSASDADMLSDMVPYRCPKCGNQQRFSTLKDLKLHLDEEHAFKMGCVKPRSRNKVFNHRMEGEKSNVTLGKYVKTKRGGKFSPRSSDSGSGQGSILKCYDNEAKFLERKVEMAKETELKNKLNRNILSKSRGDNQVDVPSPRGDNFKESLTNLNNQLLRSRHNEWQVAQALYHTEGVIQGVEEAAENRCLDQQGVIRDLVNDLRQKEGQLSQANRDLQKVRREREVLLSEVEELFSEANTGNRLLQEELGRREHMLGDVNRQLGSLRTKACQDLDRKDGELVAAESRVEALEKEREQLVHGTSSLLEQADHDRVILQRTVQTKEKQLRQVNKEVDKLKMEQEDLVQESIDLYKKANDGTEKLKHVVKAKDNQLQEAYRELENMKKVHEKLIWQSQELTQQADSNNQTLTDMLRSKEKELEQAKRELSKVKENNMAAFKVVLVDKESELAQARSELVKVKAEKAAMLESVKGLAQRASSQGNELEQLQCLVQEKEQKLQEKERDLNSLKKFLSSAAEKEVMARSKLEQFISGLIDRADKAESELQQIRSRSASEVSRSHTLSDVSGVSEFDQERRERSNPQGQKVRARSQDSSLKSQKEHESTKPPQGDPHHSTANEPSRSSNQEVGKNVEKLIPQNPDTNLQPWQRLLRENCLSDSPDTGSSEAESLETEHGGSLRRDSLELSNSRRVESAHHSKIQSSQHHGSPLRRNQSNLVSHSPQSGMELNEGHRGHPTGYHGSTNMINTANHERDMPHNHGDVMPQISAINETEYDLGVKRTVDLVNVEGHDLSERLYGQKMDKQNTKSVPEQYMPEFSRSQTDSARLSLINTMPVQSSLATVHPPSQRKPQGQVYSRRNSGMRSKSESDLKQARNSERSQQLNEQLLESPLFSQPPFPSQQEYLHGYPQHSVSQMEADVPKVSVPVQQHIDIPSYVTDMSSSQRYPIGPFAKVKGQGYLETDDSSSQRIPLAPIPRRGNPQYSNVPSAGLSMYGSAPQEHVTHGLNRGQGFVMRPNINSEGQGHMNRASSVQDVYNQVRQPSNVYEGQGQLLKQNSAQRVQGHLLQKDGRGQSYMLQPNNDQVFQGQLLQTVGGGQGQVLQQNSVHGVQGHSLQKDSRGQSYMLQPNDDQRLQGHLLQTNVEGQDQVLQPNSVHQVQGHLLQTNSGDQGQVLQRHRDQRFQGQILQANSGVQGQGLQTSSEGQGQFLQPHSSHGVEGRLLQTIGGGQGQMIRPNSVYRGQSRVQPSGAQVVYVPVDARTGQPLHVSGTQPVTRSRNIHGNGFTERQHVAHPPSYLHSVVTKDTPHISPEAGCQRSARRHPVQSQKCVVRKETNVENLVANNCSQIPGVSGRTSELTKTRHKGPVLHRNVPNSSSQSYSSVADDVGDHDNSLSDVMSLVDYEYSLDEPDDIESATFDQFMDDNGIMWEVTDPPIHQTHSMANSPGFRRSDLTRGDHTHPQIARTRNEEALWGQFHHYSEADKRSRPALGVKRQIPQGVNSSGEGTSASQFHPYSEADKRSRPTLGVKRQIPQAINSSGEGTSVSQQSQTSRSKSAELTAPHQDRLAPKIRSRSLSPRVRFSDERQYWPYSEDENHQRSQDTRSRSSGSRPVENTQIRSSDTATDSKPNFEELWLKDVSLDTDLPSIDSYVPLRPTKSVLKQKLPKTTTLQDLRNAQQKDKGCQPVKDCGTQTWLLDCPLSLDDLDSVSERSSFVRPRDSTDSVSSGSITPALYTSPLRKGRLVGNMEHSNMVPLSPHMEIALGHRPEVQGHSSSSASSTHGGMKLSSESSKLPDTSANRLIDQEGKSDQSLDLQYKDEGRNDCSPDSQYRREGRNNHSPDSKYRGEGRNEHSPDSKYRREGRNDHSPDSKYRREGRNDHSPDSKYRGEGRNDHSPDSKYRREGRNEHSPDSKYRREGRNDHSPDSKYRREGRNDHSPDSKYRREGRNDHSPDSKYRREGRNEHSPDSKYRREGRSDHSPDSKYRREGRNDHSPDSKYRREGRNDHSPDSQCRREGRNEHSPDSQCRREGRNDHSPDSPYRGEGRNEHSPDSPYRGEGRNDHSPDSPYRGEAGNDHSPDSPYRGEGRNDHSPDSQCRREGRNEHSPDSQCRREGRNNHSPDSQYRGEGRNDHSPDSPYRSPSLEKSERPPAVERLSLESSDQLSSNSEKFQQNETCTSDGLINNADMNRSERTGQGHVDTGVEINNHDNDTQVQSDDPCTNSPNNHLTRNFEYETCESSLVDGNLSNQHKLTEAVQSESMEDGDEGHVSMDTDDQLSLCSLEAGSTLSMMSSAESLLDSLSRSRRDVVRRRRLSLYLVFRYLDTKSLGRIAGVCREWKKVSRQSALWKRVCLTHTRCTSKTLETLSRWCTQMEFLHLEDVYARRQLPLETDDDYAQAVRACLETGLEKLLQVSESSLRSVSIINCPHVLTDKCMWLASCYSRMLQKVCYHSNIHLLGPDVLWALGAGCGLIRSLDIAPLYPCPNTEKFTNKCLQIISQFLPELEHLSVGGKQVDINGFVLMAKSCQRLYSLSIHCSVEVAEDVAVAMCRMGLKGLRSLSFVHTPVTDKALLHFYSACKHLRYVHVSFSLGDVCTDPESKENMDTFNKRVKSLEKLKKTGGLWNILRLEVERDQD